MLNKKPVPNALLFPERELKLAEKGGEEILGVLKERRRIIGEFAIKILHNFSMLTGLSMGKNNDTKREVLNILKIIGPVGVEIIDKASQEVKSTNDVRLSQ
jgi:hypothetical protein